MKKIILIFSLFFLNVNLYSHQLLKEISKTFDNGSPMFIDYLEPENLKKVKTEIFNEEGTRIFLIQFNPISGLADGEFFDLINKGSFKNGVLTCHKCMLVEENSPSVFTYNYNKMNTLITQGDVIDGRLVGLVSYKNYSENTYQAIDWESTRKYVAAGAGIGFRDVVTYKTGQFKENFLGSYFFNSNGVIDGDVEIPLKNWKVNISSKNGIISSYVLKDEKGLVVDSLNRDSKIWKTNYKFVKNNGFPIIKSSTLLNKYDSDFLSVNSNQYFDLLNYFVSPIKRSHELEDYYLKRIKNKEYLAKESFEEYGATSTNGIILLGGIQVFQYEEFGSSSIYARTLSFDTGGPKMGLDINGLYSIRISGALDNIIHYDIDKYTYSSGQDPYDFRNVPSNRNSNLFVMIYNYLINNDLSLFKSTFYDGTSYKYFVSSLSGKNWESYNGDGDGQIYSVLNKKSNAEISKDYILNNSFAKYVKERTFKTPINTSSGDFEYTLSNFFKDVISLSDYLIACDESMKNNETEIQEIFVWDNVKKNYVLVDFKLLIAKAVEKEGLSGDLSMIGKKSSLDTLEIVMTTDKNLTTFSNDLYIYKNEIIDAFKRGSAGWHEFNIEKIDIVSDGSDDYYKFYLSKSSSFLEPFIKEFVLPELLFYEKNENIKNDTAVIYYKIVD
jgi:hypothetical protein